MANGNDTYRNYIMSNYQDGEEWSPEETDSMIETLKGILLGELPDDSLDWHSHPSEEASDEGIDADIDGDGVYETVDFPARDRSEEELRAVSRLRDALTGKSSNLLKAIHGRYSNRLSPGEGTPGLAMSPEEWSEKLLSLHGGGSPVDMDSLHDLLVNSYNGNVGSLEEFPQEFLGYVDDIYDALGITDPDYGGESSAKGGYEDDDDDGGTYEVDGDISYHDTDGNSTKETAVVTGGTKKELKRNANKAVKQLETGGSKEVDSSDSDIFGDDDDDVSDVKKKEVKKEKKEKEKETVSDETMKNIAMTLMDYRY